MYRALLLTGVTGAGKSTVANAIGGLLTDTGLPTAVVDTDALAQFGGRPGSSDFYDELKCTNLAAVWANYRAAGARFIIVSGGVDSRRLRDQHAESLPDCALLVVRLLAPTETIRERLSARDGGATLERHLNALADQEAKLEAATIEDFTILNDRPAPDVAREILSRAGWITPPE